MSALHPKWQTEPLILLRPFSRRIASLPTAPHHLLLLLHDADVAIAAGSGSHADLSVTIIRVTPAPAFEQPVRSGDATKGGATWQIAALINHPASTLADV